MLLSAQALPALETLTLPNLRKSLRHYEDMAEREDEEEKGEK